MIRALRFLRGSARQDRSRETRSSHWTPNNTAMSTSIQQRLLNSQPPPNSWRRRFGDPARNGEDVARSNPQPRRQAKGGHAPSAAPMADEASVDLGELPDAIGYVLRRVQLAIFDDFIRSLASVDLRPSQFSALVVIDLVHGLEVDACA